MASPIAPANSTGLSIVSVREAASATGARNCRPPVNPEAVSPSATSPPSVTALRMVRVVENELVSRPPASVSVPVPMGLDVIAPTSPALEPIRSTPPSSVAPPVNVLAPVSCRLFEPVFTTARLPVIVPMKEKSSSASRPIVSVLGVAAEFVTTRGIAVPLPTLSRPATRWLWPARSKLAQKTFDALPMRRTDPVGSRSSPPDSARAPATTSVGPT